MAVFQSDLLRLSCLARTLYVSNTAGVVASASFDELSDQLA